MACRKKQGRTPCPRLLPSSCRRDRGARPALTTERSPICHGMYWKSEIGTAAIAYLETSIRTGAKPIRPTRIRTSGDEEGQMMARWPPTIQIGHLTPKKNLCDPLNQETHTLRLSSHSRMTALRRLCLKNSEIAVLRKSRKCRMLAISATARLCRIE